MCGAVNHSMPHAECFVLDVSLTCPARAVASTLSYRVTLGTCEVRDVKDLYSCKSCDIREP